MLSSRSRALLALAILTGFAAGCGGTRQTGHTTSTPGPTVTSDDIERLGPGAPIEEVLMYRFPGVQVERTGDGGVAVRIRGAASFYGGTQPLYVLDDIPIVPGHNGSLTGINPHDIASIKVLKNPTDTAIYGVRGANGVIVIKTKRAGSY